MGMNAIPATMANAAPGNAAATPAPTVPVVAQATDPVVTAAPGQTENIMPNQPTEGNTLPADGQVIGQVMPGVRGANAPVVADNAPSRDVKLTFAQIAPPPGSMVLRGINPNGGIEFGMRSDEVVSNAVLNLEYTPSPSGHCAIVCSTPFTYTKFGSPWSSTWICASILLKSVISFFENPILARSYDTI